MKIIYTDTTLEIILWNGIAVNLWLNDGHIGELYFEHNVFNYFSDECYIREFDTTKDCLHYICVKYECNTDQLELELTS